MKIISKSVQKEPRAVARARKSARVTKILEEFKDLQRMADVRGNGKKSCIGSVMDKDGIEKTTSEI